MTTIAAAFLAGVFIGIVAVVSCLSRTPEEPGLSRRIQEYVSEARRNLPNNPDGAAQWLDLTQAALIGQFGKPKRTRPPVAKAA